MATLSISQTQYATVQQSPDFFLDGLVSGREIGLVVVNFLHDEECVLRIFEAPVDFHLFTLGEPVAFHRIAGVLACHELWISARELIVHR